jgi:hypothetical protein
MGVLQLDNQQKGLRFDGVSQFAGVPNIASFVTNYASSFSAVIDVNVVVVGVRYLFTTANFNNTFKGFGIRIDYTRLIIDLFTTGSRFLRYEISFSFASNTNYHIAVSYSNGVCNIYVNGTLYSNSVNGLAHGGYLNTDNTTNTTIPYQIFSVVGGSSTTGVCRDFKLYNRAITGSEVIQLYNRQEVTSGLLVDYLFNNQSGLTITDNTGNSRTGSLNNYTTPDTTIGSTNKWVYDYSSEPFNNSRKNGVLLINNN